MYSSGDTAYASSGWTKKITIEPLLIKYSLYGAYLTVVYQDSNATTKTICINDSFDMLCSKASYSVNVLVTTLNKISLEKKLIKKR
ncbi:MAG: DUF3344 domain-containing protein [Methanobacterium sp.]|nr:DUF3344 domain-containing protein [Methanobacterium sp.]